MSKKISIPCFILFGLLAFSCKTTRFMRAKIPPVIDTSVVGLVLRFENSGDTSIIAETIKKAIEDCGMQTLDGIFKDAIYEDALFSLLLKADSAFISSQPTLNNINQVFVVSTHIIRKKNDQGKNTVGIEMLGKWVSLSPIKLVYTFYYAEKMNSAGNEDEIKTVMSYLSGQILKKLCVEIRQYIFKTK